MQTDKTAIQKAIEQLSERSVAIAREDARLKDNLDNIYKITATLKIVGTAFVAIVGWVCYMQWTVKAQGDTIKGLTTALEVIHAERDTEKFALQDIRNTIAGNRAERIVEIAAIRADVIIAKAYFAKVDEMWFMQQHGISNKEEFQRRNGYAAPTTPTSPP